MSAALFLCSAVISHSSVTLCILNVAPINKREDAVGPRVTLPVFWGHVGPILYNANCYSAQQAHRDTLIDASWKWRQETVEITLKKKGGNIWDGELCSIKQPSKGMFEVRSSESKEEWKEKQKKSRGCFVTCSHICVSRVIICAKCSSFPAKCFFQILQQAHKINLNPGWLLYCRILYSSYKQFRVGWIGWWYWFFCSLAWVLPITPVKKKRLY